ncbi:MAG: RNA 2',3'-cyclic phosphodiesterase [Candidatus Parcubacteria bacterium]|nr:MAG: RNA 2',3'-cyclic phosphodiesterase [Candidatus Parcubacteria bacterium]
MRLFLAFDLDQKDKDRLKLTLHKIKKDFPLEKWIPEENWHLTLAFLGNIYDDETIKQLASLLQIVSKKQPTITTTIYKIDFAPPQTIVKRMIWAYLKNTEELENIYQKIKTSLNKMNIQQISQNNFLPHINLVRLQKTYKNKQLNQQTNINITLQTITLYQSILRPEGAKYVPLSSAKLN